MLGRILTSAIVALITVGCATTQSTTTHADGATTASGIVAADPLLSLPTSVSAETKEAQPRPVTAAEQFDHALNCLAHDQQPDSALSLLAPEERQLVSSVTDSIAGFRNALKDPNALMSTRTAPLVALSQQLDSQLPLEIPTLLLCKSVQQFGMYEPFDPPRFETGKLTPAIVYCELSHFRSRLSDSHWQTKLTYEAALYRDGENSAMPVIEKKPSEIVDQCRNRRRDFFLADRLNIPSNLAVGRYLLKVTVVDQIGNHVAEKTIPILIAAPAAAVE